MPEHSLRRACGWLARRPGYLFLTAREETVARHDPSRFRRAWIGLAVGAVGWGLLLVYVWSLAWWVYGGYASPLIMPSAAALAYFALWPYREALAALAGLGAGGDGPVRPLLLAVSVVFLGLCFMQFSPGPYIIEYPILPWWMNWVRPGAALNRVLFLMPLWGGWSMLITPQFCRPGADTEPQTAALARGCPPLAAAGCLLPPLAATIFYFQYLGLGAQIVISAAGALGAILTGLACCRRSGGLRRRALLAANVLTQVVFLLACLAFR